MNGMEWTDYVIVHNTNQTKNFTTTKKLTIISLNEPTDYIIPELSGVIGLGYSKDEDNQNTILHILPLG